MTRVLRLDDAFCCPWTAHQKVPLLGVSLRLSLCLGPIRLAIPLPSLQDGSRSLVPHVPLRAGRPEGSPRQGL